MMAKAKKRSRGKAARTAKANPKKVSFEQQVWDALDLAQSQVKHLVDREKQSERLGKDILNLRLKG
jgi:hypothetical protein